MSPRRGVLEQRGQCRACASSNGGSSACQASDVSDIEIDPGAVTLEVDAALRSFPNVTAANYWLVYAAYPLTVDGRVDERLFGPISFTTDGRYLHIDRLAITSGRGSIQTTRTR
jgi:hypothetical protein